MMKKSLLGVLAVSVFSIHAYAEVSQVLSAGLGTATYEYTEIDSFNYNVLDLGYSIGWESIYISTNAMLSISEGSGSLEFDPEYPPADVTFKRSQYSVNLGYRFENAIALFTGINYADSQMDIAYYGEPYDIEITEVGIHVGVAGTVYAWENIGAITAKAAVSASTMDVAVPDPDVENVNESGYGYLFGLGWSGVFTDDLGYYLNFDGYAYSYEETDSSFSIFRAGVNYMF